MKGDAYYNKPMLNLSRLQDAIRHASFESDKLIIAKQAISFTE